MICLGGKALPGERALPRTKLCEDATHVDVARTGRMGSRPLEGKAANRLFPKTRTPERRVGLWNRRPPRPFLGNRAQKTCQEGVFQRLHTQRCSSSLGRCTYSQVLLLRRCVRRARSRGVGMLCWLCCQGELMPPELATTLGELTGGPCRLDCPSQQLGAWQRG